MFYLLTPFYCRRGDVDVEFSLIFAVSCSCLLVGCQPVLGLPRAGRCKQYLDPLQVLVVQTLAAEVVIVSVVISALQDSTYD